MQFNILAVDSRQQVVALNLEAASEALAADQVRARGLTVISLQGSGFRLPQRRTRFPATLFSMELLSLLEAGLNLVEALQTLAEKEAEGGNSGDRKEVLTGFKGRKAIGELLVLNDELRELIAARAPARKLKDAARAAGTVPLRDAAMALVQAGETTLEEINRVTFVA